MRPNFQLPFTVSPAKVIVCPVCFHDAKACGKTMITLNGDERHGALRWICDNPINPHMTLVILENVTIPSIDVLT